MTTTGRPAFAAWPHRRWRTWRRNCWALKPELTVAELRRAIVESAYEKNIGPQKRIKLLDPKAA